MCVNKENKLGKKTLDDWDRKVAEEDKRKDKKCG
jgi:hypothetical protein